MTSLAHVLPENPPRASLSLTKSQATLMRVLRARQVATHEALYEALYWLRAAGERPQPYVIAALIWQLRQKLPPASIDVVWGVGYRLTPSGHRWVRENLR